MLTIKDMIDDVSLIDEMKLMEISDKLYEMGSLEEIKEEVSPDLFNLHVGINMIANWKEGGWWFITGEMADFVSYIPAALDAFHLPEIKAAFENVIKQFPEYTVFKSNDAAYYDIYNFFLNSWTKVEDERLKSIPKEKRKEMVKEMRQSVDRLEDLTEEFWGDDAECKGWKQVLDFIPEKC